MERLLKSRYKIKDRIGEGPFSITYKGSLLDRDAPLIIKIYKRSVLSSSLIKVVKRKVRDLCSISHKNIAKVIDGDYGWQGFYFVREFVEGKTLSEYLRAEPKLEIEAALGIFLGICEGLRVSHDKGIIHGALCPNNVAVAGDGSVKLMDFIIVGEMREAVRERAEKIVSSSSYMSPEEVMGEIPGTASDIYAAGLLLYIMLAGGNPYGGEGGLRTSVNILKTFPESLKRVRGDVPDYVDAIVSKAMEKDPMMRFRSMDNLIASVKARKVIEGTGEKIEVPDISLESLIETAEDIGAAPRVEKEGSKPNFLLLFAVIALAALFGIGYAVLNRGLSK